MNACGGQGAIVFMQSIPFHVEPARWVSRIGSMLSRLYLCAFLILTAGLCGCNRRPAPSPTSEAAGRSESLPLNVSRSELRRMVIESQRKRVMGRLHSLRDVERVIREDAPIIAEAANLREVQSSVRLFTMDQRLTLEEAQKRWIALEEADI